MEDNKVVVSEVKSVSVTKASALRIFVGKFIVDFVETLTSSLPIGVLFLPASLDDVQKLWLILSVPVGAAFVSALRRGWPTLKDWLLGMAGQMMTVFRG